MRIVVNGSQREFAGALTVAELVLRLAGERDGGRGLAVAVDAQVVPRSEWDRVTLSEGQRVEVLGAIQGG